MYCHPEQARGSPPRRADLRAPSRDLGFIEDLFLKSKPRSFAWRVRAGSLHSLRMTAPGIGR